MYQVSAAILARVLEEREKERKTEQKFCIDIGTQTHGWHFPDATELVQQVQLQNFLNFRSHYMWDTIKFKKEQNQ